MKMKKGKEAVSQDDPACNILSSYSSSYSNNKKCLSSLAFNPSLSPSY